LLDSNWANLPKSPGKAVSLKRKVRWMLLLSNYATEVAEGRVLSGKAERKKCSQCVRDMPPYADWKATPICAH
jgi:hypothetical protein